MSTEVQVTPIGPQLGLGEGPHWDVKTETLYYVDPPNSTIHRYVPHTNEHSYCKLKGHLPFVIPVEGKERSEFVVGLERDIVHVVWDLASSDPISTKVLINIEEDRGGNIVNDAKVDPMGRLWAGTLKVRNTFEEFLFDSHLYSFEKGFSKKTQQLSGVALSNGLAWSLDHKTLFYIDTVKLKVQAFDYEKNSGIIGNERTAFDFKANNVEGYPDGMTIDSEGKLWVAVFDGAQVIRIDPLTHKILLSVPIPSPEVTSVTFGGPNLDELYVTTGNKGWSKPIPKDKFPFAGHTFKVTNLGVKGTPGRSVKLS